jgi:peptidoglycan/LPS O-acetylase OafA/YrhL
MTTPASDVERVEALTFLRFVAAVIVVIFHFGKDTQLVRALYPFIFSGPQMVTFFFCLSGFVLMVSHFEKKSETFTGFYLSRIARIVPVYLLALVIAVHFRYGTENNGLNALVLSATFLQAWFPPYALSLNGPGWSLSIEAFFYLTLPLLVFVIRASQVRALTLLSIAIGVYLLTQLVLSNLLRERFENEFPSALFFLINYFPLAHYCSFLLGVTGGYIFVKYRTHFLREGPLPLILMLLVFVGTYFALQYPDVIGDALKVPLAFSSSFYAPLFLAVVMSVAYAKNVITKTLSLPFLILLGESSYSVYILQHPLRFAYEQHILSVISLGPDSSFFIYLGLLILISIATFLFVERPAKRWIISFGRKLAPRLGQQHARR